MTGDTLFAAVATPGTTTFDLDDITITVYPTTSTWRDHAAPHALQAAIARCATRRYRNREAQRSHARFLNEFVLDVLRNPTAVVPECYASDVRECLEGHSIDEARKQIVRERVLAAIAERGLRTMLVGE